jgi:hypothetical protein
MKVKMKIGKGDMQINMRSELWWWPWFTPHSQNFDIIRSKGIKDMQKTILNLASLNPKTCKGV